MCQALCRVLSVSFISFDANKSPETVSILQTRRPRQTTKPGLLTTSQLGLACSRGDSPKAATWLIPFGYTDEETKERRTTDPEEVVVPELERQ